MKRHNLILALFLLLFLTSCSNEHIHNFNTVIINPSCTIGGESYEKCECGEIQNKQYIQATGHIFIDGECLCGERQNEEFNVIFKDYDNTILKEEKVKKGNSATPPSSPTRERYEFIGWSEEFESVTSNLIIFAMYEKEIITVGENKKFSSIQDAIDYAVDGDIIYIDKGIYDGFIINKSVEIRGNNFNIDSKSSRSDETIISSDIIINASNVTINGIEMIDKAKFTFDDLESSVENIKFEYCKITNSTVNDNNARDVAVFNLVSNNNYIIRNITIDNCYIEKTTTSRSMIIYAVDIDGLAVRNSCFCGTANRGSFNDGIKIDNQENGKAQFGIKGNVIIENNIFKNYSQYPIWFRQYSDGNYLIQNNTFENIGQTNDAHAAVNFIKSVESENIEINVLNNEIINGYLLFRIDELNSDIDNVHCNVNNNIMINSLGKYYIKNNVDTLIINAQKNYYGTSNVDSSKFLGNVDYSNYIASLDNVSGYERLELTYENMPYIEVGETTKINYECIGFNDADLIWSSSNENIALVNEIGEVTGIKKGTVEIIVKSNKYNIEKTIQLEIYDNINNMEEVTQFLLSIMNSYSYSVTAANSRTNYGVTNPYLYSIYRGATKYLFEDLVIDTDSYSRNGEAPLINNKVEYITIHDTWAMQRTAKGLAEYFQKDITSVHYTVGNDGVYQIVRLTDKGAHAGDSPYRAYALEKTNVLATSSNPIITMIDGYFAINGTKTQLRPYTDYEGTIQDKNNYTTEQLTYNGIRCIIGEDGYYYLGKTYFNETYKTVSNFGGNANSIGIEMESMKGNDFYFTMQRTAKVVAMLLEKFDLTTNDVKMHNFFSGKNCAQLLKNNLKYKYDYQIDKHNINDTLWDEFLELCDVELKMIEFSKQYKFEFISSDLSLLTNTGRVISHKTTNVCVPYVIRITNIDTNEQTIINSSIIIPSSLDIDPCYIN